MQAGQLRQRITIHRGTDTAAADGSQATTWATWASRWAKIEPLAGREAAYARTFVATVSHKITLRFLDGLLPTMRVLFNGRVFAINAVLDTEELGAEHIAYCTEIVGEAVADSLPYTPPLTPGVGSVVSVVWDHASGATWTFSADCTVSGTISPELVILGDSSETPTGPGSVTNRSVWFPYPDNSITDGNTWNVAAKPACVTVANGGTFTVPETGQMTS